MDEIQTRLQEASQNCIKAYAEWVGKKRDPKAQETLHSSIHELRKVSSRLEIELAISERDQMTAKPLPIPSHRSSKAGAVVEDEDDSDIGQAAVMSGGGGGLGKQRRRMHGGHQPRQHQGNHNQGNVQGGGNVNPNSHSPSPEKQPPVEK